MRRAADARLVLCLGDLQARPAAQRTPRPPWQRATVRAFGVSAALRRAERARDPIRPRAASDASLARQFAAKSPQLMRMGRKAFMHAIDSDYRRGISGAVNLISAVIGTEDSKEGLTAFVEKRKPVWKPRKV